MDPASHNVPVRLAFRETKHYLNSRHLFFSMKQLDAMSNISAASSIILALATVINVAYGLSATSFHVTYLLTLGFLSVHLGICTVLGKNRLAMATAVSVMVCFGLFGGLSVPYPVIAGTDAKFELQNVNRILSTGVIHWGQGTGFAGDYSYFPGLEIVVSIVSLVSTIPHVVLLKYAGSFVCIITVMFLFCAYSRRHQQRVCGLAAALAALSPWFISFDSAMVHQAVALPLLAMVLLSWSEWRGREWIFVALLGVVGIAITHAFTSYVLIFLLLALSATVWLFGKKTLAGLPNLTRVTAVAAVVVVSTWTVFVASSYLPYVSHFLASATDHLLLPEPTLAPVTPTGYKPLWVVALIYVGFVTYFSFAFGGFLRGILRKNSQGRTEAWLALSGFLILGAVVAPFLAGVSTGEDLKGRGLIYLYFLASPLVAQSLGGLAGIAHSGPCFRFPRRAPLAVVLIFVILVPVVYYGYTPALYDPSSPIIYKGDPRLSVGEWQAVAGFSQNRISAHVVQGVSLAKDFVGAVGEKEVEIISVPVGGTLLDWVQQHPGQFIFLRVSIIHTPDVGHVSENDLLSTFGRVNVLYSSADVVVLESRQSVGVFAS